MNNLTEYIKSFLFPVKEKVEDDIPFSMERLNEITKNDFVYGQKHDKPTEVIIKPEALDTSALSEGQGIENLWRPTEFSQYIGQTEAKERVMDYIAGCKKFNEQFPHTFLSAPPGCGKTAFSLILSNLLGKKMVQCTGGDLKSEQQLIDKIVECEGGILFVDEAHRISRKIGTFMLPLLEDFSIQGKKIKPFTVIFATTHRGTIAKHLDALLQRFQLEISLKDYKIEELAQIIKQYKRKKYSHIEIQDNIINEIANNCRNTPRLGLTLLKEYAYTLNWQRVLNNNEIIKNSLTKTDLRVLRYLKDNNGGGKNSLSKYLRVEPNTYEFNIEPFLIFLGFITVDNRRQITNLGKEFLQNVN